MLFNSWTFVVFLVITFGLYHFIPWPHNKRLWCQIGLLTMASYVFYAWHTPWLIVILAGSTWINAFVTLKLVSPTTGPGRRKPWLLTAICTNLGLLAFFKYTSLIVRSFLPQYWWAHWGWDISRIPLPVGISFFTFQGISLVVDVYRAGPSGMPGIEPPHSRRESGELFLRMAFFKAFFPQLVAGPIVKAHEFMYQIKAKSLQDVDWDDVVKKLILGFFLKMVVADNLREVTAGLSYPAFLGLPWINLLFLLYGFSFQIFADFAGYSLIAMGLARLFGYKLPINFDFPYISQSITEFWRRWHISLSTWLKQYLYFPLGGNRKGPLRTYINLMLVMLLGGLWHGAAWSYMVWGGAHGLFLVTERLFASWSERHSRFHLPQFLSRPMAVLRTLVTFHVASFLWLLFQLPKFNEAVAYVRELTAWHPGFQPQPIFAIALFSFPVVLYHLAGFAKPRWGSSWEESFPRVYLTTSNVGYALLLFLIITNSGNAG